MAEVTEKRVDDGPDTGAPDLATASDAELLAWAGQTAERARRRALARLRRGPR